MRHLWVPALTLVCELGVAGSYHDTALLLLMLTQQRHGGGLEVFCGIERLVAWADLADTRLLHPLCLAGICAPNDCISLLMSNHGLHGCIPGFSMSSF